MWHNVNMEPCIFYDINKERDTILHNSREKRGDRERDGGPFALREERCVCGVRFGRDRWMHVVSPPPPMIAPPFSCSTTDLGTSGELQVSDLRKVGCTGFEEGGVYRRRRRSRDDLHLRDRGRHKLRWRCETRLRHHRLRRLLRKATGAE